ncbi:Redoxin [Enhygromyxa salina]|uniref:Redoxin n=1 Tax=Enhygromyxa salina TaxID=215803 RepID=A0A2S9YBG0_9BACT|nr:redoxin family protein [Enhygromyxa salina]PRQ02392.1 Redoxin [Enhygromyxa salina]
MRAPSLRSISFALLTVLGGAQVGACEGPPASERAPAPRAGPKGVVDLDGGARDPLAPDGRADVLIFVRTDCPISNRYAPKLGRVAARFAAAPVDLWLVYVDPDETPAMIRAHLSDYALPGTALRDPAQSLVARAGVEVTPSAAVFDAEGVRRYRGRIDDWYVDYGKARAKPSTDELVDALDAVLAGRAPARAQTEAVGCPIPPLPGAVASPDQAGVWRGRRGAL